MKKVFAAAMLGLFLMSAVASAKSMGQNFQFYVTDNRSGVGIDAATVEVNKVAVCVTTKGFCEKVLEYVNGQRVTVMVTADEYPKKQIETILTSDEPNLIGLDKPSKGRGRRPTAPPFGLASFNFFETLFVSPQDSTGREILINFSVLVQDVANARIPNADVTVIDRDGTKKTGKTNRNGLCQFEKLKQGRIRISVTADGFAKGSVAQGVSNKQQIPITLRVPER